MLRERDKRNVHKKDMLTAATPDLRLTNKGQEQWIWNR